MKRRFLLMLIAATVMTSCGHQENEQQSSVTKVVCSRSQRNNQCIGVRCPFFPKEK